MACTMFEAVPIKRWNSDHSTPDTTARSEISRERLLRLRDMRVVPAVTPRFIATQQQDCTAFGVKGMEYPVRFAAVLYTKFAQFCRNGDIPAMPADYSPGRRSRRSFACRSLTTNSVSCVSAITSTKVLRS